MGWVCAFSERCIVCRVTRELDMEYLIQRVLCNCLFCFAVSFFRLEKKILLESLRESRGEGRGAKEPLYSRAESGFYASEREESR